MTEDWDALLEQCWKDDKKKSQEKERTKKQSNLELCGIDMLEALEKVDPKVLDEIGDEFADKFISMVGIENLVDQIDGMLSFVKLVFCQGLIVGANRKDLNKKL